MKFIGYAIGLLIALGFAKFMGATSNEIFDVLLLVGICYSLHDVVTAYSMHLEKLTKSLGRVHHQLKLVEKKYGIEPYKFWEPEPEDD